VKATASGVPDHNKRVIHRPGPMLVTKATDDKLSLGGRAVKLLHRGLACRA